MQTLMKDYIWSCGLGLEECPYTFRAGGMGGYNKLILITVYIRPLSSGTMQEQPPRGTVLRNQAATTGNQELKPGEKRINTLTPSPNTEKGRGWLGMEPGRAAGGQLWFKQRLTSKSNNQEKPKPGHAFLQNRREGVPRVEIIVLSDTVELTFNLLQV